MVRGDPANCGNVELMFLCFLLLRRFRQILAGTGQGKLGSGLSRAAKRGSPLDFATPGALSRSGANQVDFVAIRPRAENPSATARVAG